MTHMGNVSVGCSSVGTTNAFTVEASVGVGLARALAEHVSRMGVTGFSDELLVQGETWGVIVKLRPSVI